MPTRPNTILFNANIITLDVKRPKAGWLVIGGGKIIAIGTGDNRPAPSGRIERIDCHGKTVLPGFVDAHIHLEAFVERLTGLNVSPENGIRDIADLQAAIRRQAGQMPRGSLIRAKGYHEFDLAEKRHPSRHDLDRAAPHHPLKLTHRSGHAHVLNSLATQLAGISIETEDPDGGLIDREPSTGMPTGLFYEMGDFLATRIPPAQDAIRDEDISKASNLLLSWGITTIHDASPANGLERWERLCTWKRKGLLLPRLRMAVGIDHLLRQGSRPGSRAYRSAWVAPQGVKIILDETTGEVYPSQAQLNDWVWQVHRRNGQAIIHAVTRLSDKGTPIVPQEAIDALDAIKLYTAHAAEATWGENDYGTLAKGKAADLVVLNADPLAARGNAIQDIQVEMTVIGGKTVYRISG